MKIEFNGSVDEVFGEVQEFMGKISGGEPKKMVAPTQEMQETVREVKQDKSEMVAPGDWTTSDCKPTDKLDETPTVVPTVPTATTEYTLTDLTNAAAQLVRDKGDDMKLTLRDLLAKYGVKSLKDLNENNYGVVMEELKNLGADV